MTDETFSITVTEVVDEAVRAAIGDRLSAYNSAVASPDTHLPLAILIRDKADGQIMGGLCGHSFYDWLYINLFFIPDSLRGNSLGTRLLAQAEAIARTRACIGVWLDTFEFQARGFYEKQGFTLFGTLSDHPKSSNRYFLQKRLA